ncbi:MAG: hypothetical protein U1E91_00920 [Moraxella sp.]
MKLKVLCLNNLFEIKIDVTSILDAVLNQAMPLRINKITQLMPLGFIHQYRLLCQSQAMRHTADAKISVR